MIETIKKLTAFGKSIISEGEAGSASRTIGLLITICTMGVLVAATLFRHDLPNGDQLSGLAKIVGCGSVAYAANQAGKMASNVSLIATAVQDTSAIGFTHPGHEEDEGDVQ